ncbi:MAG: carbohydrate kinase family protein [Ignavibacteriaceae bacterium]|nr:carbohydrate kinase family protein [Ignavibacteriaceae bacterium]
MKILVIGHSVEDHIHLEGKEIVKPGGIYYSVLGLTKICTAADEIHLVTALQRSNQHLFKDVYNKVTTQLVSYVDEIPKVHIILESSNDRIECYENFSERLEINFNILKDYDGILINMITGFDITLEQLKQIREHFGGMIYLDVHTLSRGFDKSKKRWFRFIEDFCKWAAELDIIQVNQYEIKTLFNLENEFDIAERVLSCGTKLLIETRAEKGACLYYKESDELKSICHSVERINQNNKVGCGDIFGSVFFYTYLKTKNSEKSLIAANIAASQAVASDNLTKMNFKELE